MQIIDIAHFLQHRLSEFEAVGDGEGLHHIEHGVVDIAVAALADPTDQIRGVLRLGEIFCRGTGGPLGGEGKHRRAAGLAAGKGVGVNRHEQVGALLLRLGDTHFQRDKHVFVAGHIGLHIAFFVDQRPQATGDL
ncbi:Uncharacterised protein [Klebsiella pneumoniae]|nr:Uncharacterised protein [Klebsiella pneumoniae]